MQRKIENEQLLETAKGFREIAELLEEVAECEDIDKLKELVARVMIKIMKLKK